MNLTALEQAVYDREIKSLQTEIGKGVEIIRSALAKYSNSHISSSYGGPGVDTIQADKGDVEAFDAWVATLPIATLTYNGGYHLTANLPAVSKAPEFLRKAVLRVAISQFLKQVDSVGEIREIAEQANHAANQ